MGIFRQSSAALEFNTQLTLITEATKNGRHEEVVSRAPRILDDPEFKKLAKEDRFAFTAAVMASCLHRMDYSQTLHYAQSALDTRAKVPAELQNGVLRSAAIACLHLDALDSCVVFARTALTYSNTEAATMNTLVALGELKHGNRAAALDAVNRALTIKPNDASARHLRSICNAMLMAGVSDWNEKHVLLARALDDGEWALNHTKSNTTYEDHVAKLRELKVRLDNLLDIMSDKKAKHAEELKMAEIIASLLGKFVGSAFGKH